MTALGAISQTILSSSFVRNLFSRLIRGSGVILRLHRFSDPSAGIVDRDPVGIRRVLQFLHAEKYDLVALEEMVGRLRGHGPPLDRTVAVTIDDGYYDQATIGVPLFAEFDCPVTIFVTTGFIDRRLWFWWDKIRYVFHHTPLQEIRITLESEQVTYLLHDVKVRKRAALDFTTRAKCLSQEENTSALERLAVEAEIEIPDQAPPPFAPMTWDQVRAAEKLGMAFGPHTVTHPILARATDEQCRREVTESWERLQAEVDKPVPIFCYPNGQADDFGLREIGILKAAGFAAAVTTVPGYNSAATFQTDIDGRFALRRFGNVDSLPHVIRFVSGAERLRHALTWIPLPIVR